MNPEIKNEWTAALRSGQYIRGTGQLIIDNGNIVKHCCLGVLCEVVNRHLDEKCDIYGSYPSGTIIKTAGLSEFDPRVPFGEEKNLKHLSDLNDNLGVSFTEISDLIEKNL